MSARSALQTYATCPDYGFEACKISLGAAVFSGFWKDNACMSPIDGALATPRILCLVSLCVRHLVHDTCKVFKGQLAAKRNYFISPWLRKAQESDFIIIFSTRHELFNGLFFFIGSQLCICSKNRSAGLYTGTMTFLTLLWHRTQVCNVVLLS